MVMAAHLAALGGVDAALCNVYGADPKAGLPGRAGARRGALSELMRIDKKSEAGEIRFVVIDKPGSAVMRSAPDAMVREVIAQCSAN
jgi:3-dehydroquinate synthase